MTKSALFCLLLFFHSNTILAQEPLLKSEYSYRRYTTADGLPSVLNQRIYQDSRGFIWIVGTSGAACFDGFEFKTFLKGAFANLYHIEENSADGQPNTIRLFSNDYMYKIHPETDSLHLTLQFDNFYPTVFSGTTMPAGYGIFYTSDPKEQYLCAIRDTGIIKLMTHEDLNRLPDTYRVWYDEAQNLLYVPLEEGISVINDKGRIAFHEGIQAMCFAKYQNTLWAVASDGLYRQSFDDKFEKMIHHPIDYYSNYVLARENADGSLLFSDYSTLYRYHDNRIEKIFEANAIMDFIVDKESNIWVATYQGVYNLFGLKFKNFAFTGKPDNVRSLVYDTANKRMIAGTLNEKLFEIQDNIWRPLSYPPNPYTSEVSFEPHGSEVGGAVYLPGPGGLLYIKGRTSRWITFPDALFMFKFVIPLPDGNLLTGGNDRILKTTPSGAILQNITRTGLQQRVYSKPCIDPKGRIWIGGTWGINIIDGEDIKAIFSDTLYYSRVMNSDREGNIWFASGNRLYRATHENDIRQIRLFDSRITNIGFTQSGITVVTTLDKIHLIDRNMQSDIFFDSQNGFTGLETISADIVEDDSGVLWLPAIACLTTFNPNLLVKEVDKPHLHLLASSVSANNIQWKIIEDPTAKLNYQHKNIRFNYIGLSYTSSQNVRYHYRLLGFQNEWSEPLKNREVTFNNLPPGDYMFEIYADAGTDDSRCETLSVAFMITPAFWQTAWFLAVCIISLILVSAGITIYIQRQKNKALLEKLRAEKELNELRISSIRLKAIPHFNANVLSAIEYYIANRTKEDAMRILGIYSDFTFKTLSEVDKAARPLDEELAYVKMYLDLEKIRFLEKFDFRIQVDDEVDRRVQLPNMILHTYCENAVKHGLMPLKSGGLLIINVSQRGSIVCVSVEDNGVGRDYATHNPQLHSTKQGLAILNRQIEIYNRFNREKINRQIDDLSGENGQPCGTRFTVEVPVNFMYIN